MSDGNVQNYLTKSKNKLRYIKLTSFAKSWISFLVTGLLLVVFASFYTFVFYGGFGHPFFDFGPAVIAEKFAPIIAAVTIGAVLFALARSKTYFDRNEISVSANSLNIVRGIYFKKRYSFPYHAIFNLNVYQSAFAKKAEVVKVDLIMIDGSSVYLGVFDEQLYKKFERKLMKKLNRNAVTELDTERVQGIPATA